MSWDKTTSPKTQPAWKFGWLDCFASGNWSLPRDVIRLPVAVERKQAKERRQRDEEYTKYIKKVEKQESDG